ncbi:hypothetical protein HKX48_000019 [Thoreauomyces humboldtii]|nr:hypothetical protein HKX48_000019 [Thoreauomyces humboldtii]
MDQRQPAFYCDGGGDFFGIVYHIDRKGFAGNDINVGGGDGVAALPVAVNIVIGALWRKNGVVLCAEKTGISMYNVAGTHSFCNGIVTANFDKFEMNFPGVAANPGSGLRIWGHNTDGDVSIAGDSPQHKNTFDAGTIIVYEYYLYHGLPCPTYDWRPTRSCEWPVIPQNAAFTVHRAATAALVPDVPDGPLTGGSWMPELGDSTDRGGPVYNTTMVYH